MKCIIVSLCLAISLLPLAAQSNSTETPQKTDTAYIERNINVEKEYAPELAPAKRTNVEYTVQEQNIKKADITYSGYAADVQPTPQFYPLSALSQKILNQKTPKKGYAALGFGYPIDWLATLYYPIIATGDDHLEMLLDHKGFILGKKQLIDTDFGMKYTHNIGKSDQLHAAVGYANRYYTYYGKHNLDSFSVYSFGNGCAVFPFDTCRLNNRQSIHEVAVVVGANSITDHNGWRYTADLSYDMHLLQYLGTSQHDVRLTGEVTKAIRQHTIAVLLDFDSYFYAGDALNSKKNLKNNGILGLAPQYRLNVNGLDMKLGLKMYFSFNKGMVFNIMPDLSFRYNVHKLMDVYLDLTGDYRQVSLSSMMNECRYWHPLIDGDFNKYTPLKAIIGTNIKPMKGMMFTFDATYGINLNDHFFINKYYGDLERSNHFTAVYSNSQNIDLNARLGYNHKNRYTAYTRATYHFWYVGNNWSTPWHRPTFEWEIGTEIRPIENLMINANFFLGTGYSAGVPNDETFTTFTTIKMNNHYDLNIGASYKFKNDIAIFAQFNNLLSLSPNLRYQDWYGYDNIGFNCMLGVKFGF